uniref:E3 ubiquitin-protein ligase TRIM32 n=1 Tax=Monopterus albus TaxID=43700 RepID=A0A3Q3JD79_MONAL
MLMSRSQRRPLPGFSALLTHSTPKDINVLSPPPLSFTPRESIFTTTSLTSPPPWVTEVLSNLEQGERELQSLVERQQAEVEQVNRELDNAVIEAQREERRLLEKVEQDHREAQQHLSQLKRENAAAVRVLQSLVDQQLRKMGQLKEQIQRWGSTAGESNKKQLQRGVAEVTQPWEISLTLKRVSFLTHPESKTISLGEVHVHEQSMTYSTGVCGDQGQKCALHSGDSVFSNITPFEIRKEPQPNRGGQKYSPNETTKTKSGNIRVVRKLRLSSSTDNEDELKSPTIKCPISRHCGASESSQDDELESVNSDTQGQDLFLAVPPVSSQGESEGDEPDGRQKKTKRRSLLKGKRKQKALVLVSCEEPSCPFEETDKKNCDVTISPKVKCKSSLSRHSLVDLCTEGHPLSLQALSKKKTSNESSLDSGSPPSPVDSEDSGYTYIVNTHINRSLKQERSCLVSTTDLSGKLRPIINSNKGEHKGIRKVNRLHLVSEPSTFDQSQESGPEPDKRTTTSIERQSRSKSRVTQSSSLNRVSRSQSLSAIEGDKLYQVKVSQQDNDTEKVVSSLREMEEEGGSTALDSAHLVKQFGKQGSGRTDFNLPSGIHATVKGQLFVVDCGNARIQVTDFQKNVVQQVSPSGSERSSHICNYFDIAVNSKGLIALTCAAERAVLVFSRHGRLLQTFGGTMIGSTNEELDAPRGVTVTRQDDFLVADIKRGTLTALKLDPKTGARLERTVVTGYHRPYLVAACLSTGLMAVSERGNDSGRVPCIRVLEPGWNTIRILGVCSGLGPVLTCPWGLCIDSNGDVLVVDWGRQHHRVLLYPSKGVGWPLVTNNLNSPRGLTLLPDGHVAVSDSMNHCIKIYRYK